MRKRIKFVSAVSLAILLLGASLVGVDFFFIVAWAKTIGVVFCIAGPALALIWAILEYLMAFARAYRINAKERRAQWREKMQHDEQERREEEARIAAEAAMQELVRIVSPEKATPPPVPILIASPTSKTCPFCKEEVLGDAVKCKHCGEFINGRTPVLQTIQYPQCQQQKQGFGCLKACAVCFLLFICFCWIVGSGTDSGGVSQNSVPRDTPRKEPVELLNYQWAYTEYGSRCIRGRIRNNTEKTYGALMVNFNLYDINGLQIGNTFDIISNLGPYGVWGFSCLVSEDNAVNAVYVDVRGREE